MHFLRDLRCFSSENCLNNLVSGKFKKTHTITDDMISEKTVELNLTTELVNYLYVVTGVRPYILAPSQTQEGVLGFDTAVGFPGTGRPYLIQYKRAEFRVRKNEYLYHLNHTAKQDQHLRLYILERIGWDVFYALPLFHTPTQVITNRRHLLPMTLYLRPSWMMPIGGISAMVGHHEVRHNLTTGVTTIYSEEGSELNQQFDFFDFARILNNNDRKYSNEKLNSFFNDFNKVFANEQTFEFENIIIKPQDKEDNDAFNGLSSIVL